MWELLLSYFGGLVIAALVSGFLGIFCPPIGAVIFGIIAVDLTLILGIKILMAIGWIIADLILIAIVLYIVFRFWQIIAGQAAPMGPVGVLARTIAGTCSMLFWIIFSEHFGDHFIFAPIHWTVRLYNSLDAMGLGNWEVVGVFAVISAVIALIFMVIEHITAELAGGMRPAAHRA